MSSAKIMEGGTPRNFSGVRRLKTDLQGGGTCTWLPESELKTKELRVTEEGSYVAEQDGVFAYDSVIVNVPDAGGNSITGHDPDTGEDVTVTVDPETGELEETVLPAAIEIITRPTKTTYADGETIDYTGIVVIAVDSNGDLWENEDYPNGIIPFEELTFPVTTAHGDGGGSSSGSSESTLDGQTIPYSHDVAWSFKNSRGESVAFHATALSEGDCIVALDANTTAGLYCFSKTSSIVSRTYGETTYNGRTSERNFHFVETTGNYNYEGKTITYYYVGYPNAYWANSYTDWNGSLEISYDTNLDMGNIAKILFEGAHSGGAQSQNLAVQWSRPGDGKLLETSFDITVSGGNE